jgi:hypothetical protein
MAVEDFKVYTQDSGWVSLAQTLPQGTSEGQLLHWDGTQWAAASDGTADGQYLIWDDTAKRWEPGTHETGNLPIQSDDGTVVLDSPSANVFTVSTGGTDKLTIDGPGRFKVFNSTGTNTFFVRNDGNVGIGTNGQAYERMTIAGSLVQSSGYPAVGAKVSTSFSNDGTGAAPAVFGFESQIAATGAEGFDRVAHFMANQAGGSNTIDNHIGFLANVAGGTNAYAFYSTGATPSYFGGTVQTPTVKGLADTDAQIDLGAELLTTNHTPTQPNSIATKQTVDDKIQVMTTAEYNALGANVNPTTLYCLTD